MKKYNIYGMGNALVDMEIEVANSFLEDSKIEKGMMVLVDENRQVELLEKVGSSRHSRSCGGSAANTIIGAAQLGAKTFYSCKVASDETGDFYFNDLIGQGVDTNLHGERQSGTTGKCLVFITPDAERSMNTYLGITETFSESELSWDDIKDSEYLYLEGYLVTSPTGKAAAIKAREFATQNNVKVALTFSDPGIVDLLFCNEDEAKSYTGTENVADALEALKKISKQIAITCGERGALLWDGSERMEVLTSKVKAVDTNGAGDLFAGAFLFALSKGHSFSEAGKLACACSSELVTHFGARLSKEQTQNIYKSLF
jgi:sugar/nucleoside kinase (ribokinase family)